jgi:hypothetical protein
VVAVVGFSTASSPPDGRPILRRTPRLEVSPYREAAKIWSRFMCVLSAGGDDFDLDFESNREAATANIDLAGGALKKRPYRPLTAAKSAMSSRKIVVFDDVVIAEAES